MLNTYLIKKIVPVNADTKYNNSSEKLTLLCNLMCIHFLSMFYWAIQTHINNQKLQFEDGCG